MYPCITFLPILIIFLNFLWKVTEIEDSNQAARLQARSMFKVLAKRLIFWTYITYVKNNVSKKIFVYLFALFRRREVCGLFHLFAFTLTQKSINFYFSGYPSRSWGTHLQEACLKDGRIYRTGQLWLDAEVSSQ